MLSRLDLFLLETSSRFQSLCFQLARVEHRYAMPLGVSWDGGRDVLVYAHVETQAAQLVALQCKFVRKLDASARRSILKSLDALDSLHERPRKWILCVPIDPSGRFMDWFQAEMNKRSLPWDVWGRGEILMRLEKHQHILQTFFYGAFDELQQYFVSDDLELARIALDATSQWCQPDPRCLVFYSTGNVASPDLVFDVVVRNRGNLQAALFKIVAYVGDCWPIPHGIPDEGLLFPRITYSVPIGGGEPGRYEHQCEPPLLIAPRSYQRFKLRLVDTGYSWGGTVQIGLDYGKDALGLPCIAIRT